MYVKITIEIVPLLFNVVCPLIQTCLINYYLLAKDNLPSVGGPSVCLPREYILCWFGVYRCCVHLLMIVVLVQSGRFIVLWPYCTV